MTTNPMVTQCTATSKRSGVRCRRAPMHGQAVCYMHGGNAARARQAARVRLIEQEVARKVDRELLDGVPIEDMRDLWERLRRTGGRVFALADIFVDKATEIQDWTTTDTWGKEDVRAVLAGLERAIDRCSRFGFDMTRLNITALVADADVRLSNAQTDALYATTVEALDDLEAALTPAQKVRLRLVMSRGLAARSAVPAELGKGGVR
jgi:hypothetical protein